MVPFYPTAKIIADSISPSGKRLTTIECSMHRFVLAEFNTHRAFSRNSASSRAIPTVSMIERVVSDTALPVAWSTAKSGMRGGESHDRPELCESLWNDVATFTVATARRLTDLGVH